MKRAALFTLVVLAAAGGAAFTSPPRPFEFDGTFEPAFHPPSHLTLESSGASAKLIIKIGDSSTSVPVDLALAADFLHDVTSLRFAKSKPQEGFDGCNVNLHLSVDGKEVFASKVWSPTKASAPAEDALLRALYKVTERSQVPSQEADYLEQLYLYFDNIQPHWKVLGSNPFTVRLNEAFWVNDFPAFRAMVASLPRDQEAIFDITMLEGSSLYAGEVTKRVCDEFLKATEERSVKWRAGKGWSELLLKGGLPKDRMIPPTPKQTPQPTADRSRPKT